MTERSLRVSQARIYAAVRAVEAAGHVVARVEIGRDGTIIVIPVRPGDVEVAEDGEENWRK